MHHLKTLWIIVSIILTQSEFSSASICREAAGQQLLPSSVRIIPRSVIERLRKYSPEAAKLMDGVKPEDLSTFFHGAEVAVEDLNPVLVTTMGNSNKYFAAPETEKSLALKYMSGVVNGNDSIFSITGAEKKISEGHDYFGFVFEFKVPKKFVRGWEVDNNLFINDLLLAQRIGTVNLRKVVQLAENGTEDRESAIEWFEPVDFMKKFFSPEYVERLLSLKRSQTVELNDLNRFNEMHKEYLNAIGAYEITSIEQITLVPEDYDLVSNEFVYKDRNGILRKHSLRSGRKGEGPLVKLNVNGQSVEYSSSSITENNESVYLSIEGMRKIKIGKNVSRDEEDDIVAAPVKSRKVTFSFNQSGVLIIHVKTDQNNLD